MPATLIDGKSLAAAVRASQKSAIESLAARGVRPGLAAILAGSDPASRVYVRNKARACEETGVRSEVHEFPDDVSEAALLDRGRDVLRLQFGEARQAREIEQWIRCQVRQGAFQLKVPQHARY